MCVCIGSFGVRRTCLVDSCQLGILAFRLRVSVCERCLCTSVFVCACGHVQAGAWARKSPHPDTNKKEWVLKTDAGHDESLMVREQSERIMVVSGSASQKLPG